MNGPDMEAGAILNARVEVRQDRAKRFPVIQNRNDDPDETGHDRSFGNGCIAGL